MKAASRRTIAACQECGAQMPRWVGRCPECGRWGSVVEEPVAPATSSLPGPVETVPLFVHDLSADRRMSTGMEELDRVLGAGLVPGSVVLLAGEPGIGKSTLTLQAAMALGGGRQVLLVCGEEAPQQIKARAARLGAIPEGVCTVSDPRLPVVLSAIETSEAEIVVVDSVQTVFDPEVPSAPGSVSQVRECGARLVRAARDRGVTVVMVGHVTKEGSVAGPRVLEHLVDVVLNFEGDRTSSMRVLRALKNRFGSTEDVGFFQMTSEGLFAIRDASAYLLADRHAGESGSMLAACVDGRRPFVCEIQALIAPSGGGSGRRTAVGVDGGRLPQLIAVLEKHGEMPLASADVYVSAVGGMRASEPASDLPAAMAMISSHRAIPLPHDAVAFGEVGLSGEVRQVVASDKRLAEARNIGCKRAFVPYNLSDEFDGLELHRIRHIRDALDATRDRW